MFVCEKSTRNRLILRMLYYSGMRVSELCGLRWKDLYSGPNGTGIVAIFGKGGKERHVALKREVYEEFLSFRNEARGCTRRPGEPVGREEAGWRKVIQ